MQRNLIALALPFALSLPVASALLAGPASGQTSPAPAPSPGARVTAPASPSPAGERLDPLPPPAPGEARFIEERARAARRRGDLEGARRLFARLIEAEPQIIEHRLTLAGCLLDLGRLDEADRAYGAVRDEAGENVETCLAEARIAGRRREAERDPELRSQLEQQAGDALRRGAAMGLHALRAVRSLPELSFLRGDLVTLVALATSMRPAFDPETKDPFRCPLPRRDEVDAPVAAEPEDVLAAEHRLLAQAETLLARIEVLPPTGGGVDVALLRALSAELDALLAEARELRKASGRPFGVRLEERLRRLETGTPVLRSLRLRSLYAAGEELISRLTRALEAGSLEEAIEAGKQLEAHAKAMTERDPEFEDAARDLLAQGRPLALRAACLLEARGLPVRLTAVVLGEGRATGIVNDRIVEEGDVVRDPQGRPIDGLTVQAIGRRRVAFAFKGVSLEASVGGEMR